jgi:16S rRNA (guanine966-N2)-methyltransferase
MRVIAGKAKGRRLESVKGDTTRPITDRAKESLFAILAPEVIGARFLDLFAGTGAVAIEALSRGAASAELVELDPRAAATIKRNLEHTGLAPARVVRADVLRLLGRPPTAAFDIVFVAPPQYKGLWRATLEALDARPEWVAPDGLVVAQIHPREEEVVALAHFLLEDGRTYGSVRLLFYRRI